MPDDKTSLHRSFNQLLGSLDLPNDKIEEMNSYDDHKKWEILCSRSLMKAHQSPGAYLERLRSHVGLKISPSKDILRGLEVSLRTYTIEWLHEFLANRTSLDTLAVLVNKLSIEEENFHILLQCLRALSNDSFGCEKIINHLDLLQMVMASLRNAHDKNRVMILQLLANVCRKSMDGRRKVLKLLKATNGMDKTLIEFLSVPFSHSFSDTHQLVIAATLKLINTLLTSITELNYAVYLQYDFHKIGLDNRIERLMLNESNLIPEVIDEITAYKSMIINVNQLIKDRDGIETLREQLEKAKVKIMEMEKQLINYVRLERPFAFHSLHFEY
jgi:Diaphanous GTPase-binding Domain/Diaphanous FH3 Domain